MVVSIFFRIFALQFRLKEIRIMKKVKAKNFNERIERVANACMDEILVLLNNETPHNYFNFGKVLRSENLPTVTWLCLDYPNHIEQVNEQWTRKPKTPPHLIIKRLPKNIEDLNIDDFEIVDYDPYPAIKGKVAV